MSDQRLIELLDETTNLKIEVAKLREAVELMRGALKYYSAYAVNWTTADKALATVDAIIGDNNVKTEAVIRAESVKVYDRMNPTLDVLLVSLQMYADVDHTIDAYPLSRAEAQLIVDKLSCHIGQTNYSVTPDSSLMDKIKVCHICHYPGQDSDGVQWHFEHCSAAK